MDQSRTGNVEISGWWQRHEGPVRVRAGPVRGVKEVFRACHSPKNSGEWLAAGLLPMSTPEFHLPPFEEFEEFYVPGGHPAPPRIHFGPLAPLTIPDSSISEVLEPNRKLGFPGRSPTTPFLNRATPCPEKFEFHFPGCSLFQ